MSRTLIRWLACAAVLPALAGCFKSKVVVHVNADGSGQVVETSHAKTIDLGLPMAPTSPVDKAKERAAKAVANMGEGVTVESVSELPKDGDWQGVKVVYAFSDINKLQMVPVPLSSGDSAEEGQENAPPRKEEMVTFSFQEGAAGQSPKLTVHMPPLSKATGGATEEAPPEAMYGLLKQMFEDAEIQVAVQVDGAITNTNSKFVSKSNKAVGLLRMDLGRWVKDDAAFKQLMALDRNLDTAEVEKTFGSPPLNKYFKVEMQKDVDIEFTPAAESVTN
jgi:hypothetical protein